MTIVEFLEARLAEDEAVATKAIGRFPDSAMWAYEGEEVFAGGDSAWYVTCDSEGITPAVDEEIGPHIARHDPARVLREVAAKRNILTEYVNENWVQAQGHRTAWTEGGQAARETAVRLFASVYSDHPDYQSEWSIP